jgi:hypothetical protein
MRTASAGPGRMKPSFASQTTHLTAQHVSALLWYIIILASMEFPLEHGLHGARRSSSLQRQARRSIPTSYAAVPVVCHQDVVTSFGGCLRFACFLFIRAVFLPSLLHVACTAIYTILHITTLGSFNARFYQGRHMVGIIQRVRVAVLRFCCLERNIVRWGWYSNDTAMDTMGVWFSLLSRVLLSWVFTMGWCGFALASISSVQQ